MADCLHSYFNKKDAFANYALASGEELKLVGVATCGGCSGNQNANKSAEIIEHMLQHDIETLFLSSCLIRHEFFPPGLENQPLEEVETAVRCFFSPENSHAENQAHDVACALCAGTMESACPNKLAVQIVERFAHKVEIVTGTHYEHFGGHAPQND